MERRHPLQDHARPGASFACGSSAVDILLPDGEEQHQPARLVPDTHPKWIMLDGDLDANWIESMNSAAALAELLWLAWTL